MGGIAMRLLALSIHGFRGIQQADIRFDDHTVIIGPNGSGKSTIVDALSLVLGRKRFVRDLTEHDFYGSCPDPTSRIRIIATLGGFSGNDPEMHGAWFREGRAIVKWWNAKEGKASSECTEDAQELCAQIGFSARFDCEELTAEYVRHFHDDDAMIDVFQEDVLQQIPSRLLDEVGFFVLPTKRTWESSVSVTSELFTRAVVTVGGIPAQTILQERDRLRQPQQPLEDDDGLLPLVERINEQLSRLLPLAPRFGLRLTNTDSDSLIRALVPHYRVGNGSTLPITRHGTGLLSLQTFILVLELGRERQRQGQSFILAMEEPELHVPPGLQRRLVAQAISIAEQTICTSHSPQVAALYSATSVRILEKRGSLLATTPLLAQPLDNEASNAARKLYLDDRSRVVEALMYHRVLIPEGRTEYEWFRMLSDAVETSDRTLQVADSETPPFGAIVGVIPTHNSAVAETFERLRSVRSGLVPLVDGDKEGDNKISVLQTKNPAPEVIFQWPEGWAMEDVVGWILKGDENAAVDGLKERLSVKFSDIDGLIELLKDKKGPARLKTDYLAHQEIAAVVASSQGCSERAVRLLDAITHACIGHHDECKHIELDSNRSSEFHNVLRFVP